MKGERSTFSKSAHFIPDHTAEGEEESLDTLSSMRRGGGRGEQKRAKNTIKGAVGIKCQMVC